MEYWGMWKNVWERKGLSKNIYIYITVSLNLISSNHFPISLNTWSVAHFFLFISSQHVACGYYSILCQTQRSLQLLLVDTPLLLSFQPRLHPHLSQLQHPPFSWHPDFERLQVPLQHHGFSWCSASLVSLHPCCSGRYPLKITVDFPNGCLIKNSTIL